MDADLKEFLDEKVEKYNHINFIIDDPISIPHLFKDKADIEIIGFIMATIAWGNRKSIINNGFKLVEIMGAQPFEFVMNAGKNDFKDLHFVHRTFNSDDLRYFLHFFKAHYSRNPSLETLFAKGNDTFERIINFRNEFLDFPHDKRSEKHLSNPLKGSSAKRINMYLRWMNRKDKKGVDFGIWNTIPMSELMIPLDVHTGNIARKLNLITRSQNDWKALEELMIKIREFDPEDPSKYDFALFGLGVSKEFDLA